MVVIYVCGIGSSSKATLIRELLKTRKLRNVHHIRDVPKNVFEELNVGSGERLEDHGSVYDSLKVILENKCLFEKTHDDHGGDIISDHCVLDTLVLASMKILNKDDANRLVHDNQRIIEEAIHRYRKCLLVLESPLPDVTDDETRFKFSKEELENGESLYIDYFQQHHVPFLTLRCIDLDDRIKVILEAFQGKLPLETSSLSNYDTKRRQQSQSEKRSTNLSFYLPKPNKSRCNSIPTITIKEHKSEQEWKTFGQDECNRFIDKHGSKDLVIIAFHVSVKSRVVQKMLLDGITVNGEQYSFLGCSSSGLKKRKCYMLKGPQKRADQLIADNGKFDKKSVAKRMARIALLFSAVRLTNVEVKSDNIITEDDKNTADNKCFTDGCGSIGKGLATQLFKEVSRLSEEENYLPSVYQIRYQGYKGVLALDITLPNESIKVRPSMKKFETSVHGRIGVCGFSRPHTFGHLNKQYIMLLSGLGVPDEVFEKKQQKHFDMVEQMTTEPEKAISILQWQNKFELAQRLIKNLECGGKVNEEVLKSIRHTQSKLVSVSHKLRILIPKSRNIYGVCDPSGVLEYGQCFLRITEGNIGSPKTIKGQVVVSKPPCYLLGDVRVLTAVDTEQLNHLVDCIVFPVCGKRPHPDEIAGSDLDGDMFFVSWESDLIPPKTKPPYDYPGAQVKPQGIGFEKMVKYFAYQNESKKLTAQVNRNYLEWANIKGVDSEECKELGMLFSRVIDSAKSGETFHSQDLMTPIKDNCPSKELKFIWQILDDNADKFKRRMEEHALSKTEGFHASFDLAEEFVLSIVTREMSNISEFKKFQFVWNCISNAAIETEEKVEIFLNKYSDHLNYALFSNQEKREVIGLGIPADIVTNALRKSMLLSKDDLDVFAMNSNPNKWKFYFREDHENFNWTHLLKALTHHDKCVLVISLPDEVIIVLQFLTKQEQGEKRDVIPGTVSGFFYSKRFQYREKYVLGPEYTMDLTENRLQLYRNQDVRQTFVWLRATDQRKGKLQLGDEVLNSISVDLIRFKRQILNGPRRHPLVNKIPLVAIEVFVDNSSLTVPYFDTIEANDLEPVAETEDLESEEDYETERDLSFMLSEEDLDHAYESCETEENLKASLKRATTEGKPLLFKRFVDDWHEKPAEVPSCVSELVVSLLENIVACSTPQDLPEQVTEVIRKILLACEFHQPLQLFKVVEYLSRICLEDLAAELLIRDIDKCELDMSCFINIYSKWEFWWHIKGDIARQSISNVVRTVSSYQLSKEETSEATNRIKYLIHVGNLHLLDLLQEIKAVKERMKLEKADFSICNLKIKTTSREDDGRFLSFYRTTSLNHRPKITQGQFVAVTRQADFKKTKSHESCCCLAQVQTIRLAPLTVTVHLYGKVPAIISDNLKSEDSRLWKIDLIANITTFTRVMNAIKRLTVLEDPWLLNLLANPAGHPRDCPLFRENVQMEIPDREITLPDLEISSKLNEKQKEAVHAALEQRLTLIQGPPGTGKTTLACEIVKQAEKLGTYKKILVVAETNVAVDNIAKKLRIGLPLDILRLGTEEGVDREVFDITLDGQLKQLEEKEAKKASYRDEKGIIHRKPKLVQQILTNARVFLTTCAGAGDPLLDSQTFEFVLVDEATQTKETTLLCSLAHGVKQLVMIGDPKQLGPVTVGQRDQQPFAFGDPLDVSALSNTLFHRLYDVIPCKFLDTQHRMHPRLMEFPSREFYDGNLKCGLVPSCHLPAVFKWPDPTKPLCFINVDSTEQRSGTSFCNCEEKRIVQLVLDVLMNVPEDKHESRFDVTEIGILTLYQGQARLLSTEVKPMVEVRTVDGFQGREKEVIIVSTVRANERGTLGFLDSTNRLNVLLTRAKRGLIVVGNERTLKNSPLWNKWIEHAPHLNHNSLVKTDSSECRATGSNKRYGGKGSQVGEENQKIQDARNTQAPMKSRSSQEDRPGGMSITRERARHGYGQGTPSMSSGRANHRRGQGGKSSSRGRANHIDGQGSPPSSRGRANHRDEQGLPSSSRGRANHRDGQGSPPSSRGRANHRDGQRPPPSSRGRAGSPPSSRGRANHRDGQRPPPSSRGRANHMHRDEQGPPPSSRGRANHRDRQRPPSSSRGRANHRDGPGPSQ